MDPTPLCCPSLACPARGQTGHGNLGPHARKDNEPNRPLLSTAGALA